ncbi:MAG: hypothetical protein ACI35R_09490 [Bacillus sp. (in: firmicutes)]
MKKTVALLSILFFSLSTAPHSGSAQMPHLSPECVKKKENRDQRYINDVRKDVNKSFPLHMDDHYIEVTAENLEAAYMIYGGKEKDPYYHSLMKNFFVASRGKPQLFVKPQEAYFLYKRQDHTNVMLHLKLNGVQWEVIKETKKSGKKIQYKQLTCEKAYLKKRENYLKKKRQ